MTRKVRNRIFYIIGDIIAITLSLILFHFLRRAQGVTEDGLMWGSFSELLRHPLLLLRGLGLVLYWMVIFTISGYYNKTLNKSRLDELWNSFAAIFLGTVIEFFILIIGGRGTESGQYIPYFLMLWGLHFSWVYAIRLGHTCYIRSKNKKKENWAHVLVVGHGGVLQKLQKEAHNMRIHIAESIELPIENFSPDIGADDFPQDLLSPLSEAIKRHQPTELLIAFDDNQSWCISPLLYHLYAFKLPIKIAITPSFIQGIRIRERTLTGVPLFDVEQTRMSEGSKNIKWLVDRLVSAVVLILLAPLYAVLAIAVRCSSPGPIFFRQERIGLHGKPFNIIKFRSMNTKAEANGPQLSKDNDPRITPIGKILRKYRLDELPQFYNVLRGDMSLVGPRPERLFYINQIIQRAPYYYLLHNVRPGITSWGMVRYGYASTVEEMVERLQYDKLYYENMSLKLDITVLFYTVITIIKGKGK